MSHILHVVNIYFVIPYFLGNQLTYFREKGYDIHIICSPSEELKDYAKQQGFKYKEIPILRKISLVQDLKSVWQIFRYIRKNKIEIVTGHTPKGGLLAMIAAFWAGTKIRIYFRHGLVYETSKGLKRYLLITMDRLASMLATKIVCVSPSVSRRSLEDRLNPASKQLVLAHGTCNGIDIRRFSKENINELSLVNLRNKYGISDKDYVIGFSGRLVRDKGIVELVEAFREIHEKYPNTKLLLVGMLEARDAVSVSVVQEIQSNPAIIHTGYVDNRQMEYFYAMMHVFVLPSYREGFPTSVLEASAMELPVITTRVTGCIDSILPNETGVFVQHDSHELELAIEHFITNHEYARTMGVQGRNFVIRNFEEHIVWNEIEKLYQ